MSFEAGDVVYWPSGDTVGLVQTGTFTGSVYVDCVGYYDTVVVYPSDLVLIVKRSVIDDYDEPPKPTHHVAEGDRVVAATGAYAGHRGVVKSLSFVRGSGKPTANVEWDSFSGVTYDEDLEVTETSATNPPDLDHWGAR